MREIEYRGKDLPNVMWIYGSYFMHITRTPCPMGDSIKPEDKQATIIQDSFSDWNMPRNMVARAVREETVGQYIGIKDRNGKKIFEGDILQAGGRIFVVKYFSKYTRFALSDNFTPDKLPMCIRLMDNMEIIGNVYDNPGLLKRVSYE